MKRSILTAALALAILPALASAQGSSSASVTIAARVQSAVTITPVGAASIDFGATALAPGAAATVAASGTAAYQSEIVSNVPVTVATSANAVTLTNTDATITTNNTFSVSILCGQSATQNDAAAAAIANCSTGYIAPIGTRYYFLGAGIAAAATTGKAAGTYQGSVTINYTWSTF